MINPIFQKDAELNHLTTTLSVLQDFTDPCFIPDNPLIYEVNDKINDIRSLCNHTNKDGTSAISVVRFTGEISEICNICDCII